MKLTFTLQLSALPINYELASILEKELAKCECKLTKADNFIFNFRDDSYDPIRGGYHPVEIRISHITDHWKFDYITDFCFFGEGHCAELTKEIDFDFARNVGTCLYGGEHELVELYELFELWQSNFIDYVNQDVFTVKISTS